MCEENKGKSEQNILFILEQAVILSYKESVKIFLFNSDKIIFLNCDLFFRLHKI